MKRTGNLLQYITAYPNIRLAWLKTLRGKRNSPSAVRFARYLDVNLNQVQARLNSLDPGWGNYRKFQIYDPKQRTISAAPIAERVMHHAIMNILAPVLERPLVYHSYACRHKKGTHAAVQQAFHWSKSAGWFLKLDVRRYFDSIDHTVLYQQLQHIIKDRSVLYLLYTLIKSYSTDVGKGLPIGNLTSQFFANLYLSGMDHYILEQCRPRSYIRYMDDFVLWASNKEELQTDLHRITSYCQRHLDLQLKPPVLAPVKDGLPFLGFLIRPQGIYLTRKSKRRMKKRARSITAALANEHIDQETAAMRAQSVHAAVKLARSRQFRVQLWHGSSYGHESRQTRRQLEQQCV